jgi:hypothetical protein
MTTRRVGSILVLCQGTESPSDAEWDECLEILRPFVASAKVLVYTRGGGPSPAQRKRLSALVGKNPMRAAIVTDSVKVHFIVSSVALFMQRIRSFGLAELNAAFAHLGLSPIEGEHVKRNLDEMRELIEAMPA